MKRAVGLLLLSACTVFSLIWAPLARAQSADRVLATVNPSQVVTLGGHHPAWASPQSDVGAVPADLRLEHLTLVLARSPQVQQALEQFLQSQQDPASPDYHHWLTPVEVGQRFGVSQHDINAVSDWLRSQGLRVDSVSNSRVRITFSGPAAVVANAFGAEMDYFKVNGKQRISITAEPQIPAALAPVIKTVTGLSTIDARPMLKTPGRHFTVNGPTPQLTLGDGSHAIAPPDFATIYDLNPVYSQGITGANQTIAIIGGARVYNPDIENFQTLFGFSQKDPIVIIPPDGIDPGPPANSGGSSPAQGEATLDVQRSGSIAPGATVDLIVSGDTATLPGFLIATFYAVDTTPVPAHIMSMSFGVCEAAGQAFVFDMDNLFSQAAVEGISVFISSGDSGAAMCEPHGQAPPLTQFLSVNAFCSSSYVTCVGGTEFAEGTGSYWGPSGTLGSALSYIPEGGWNDPLVSGLTQVASSGGGVSAYIPTPYWQTGSGVPMARAGRYIPDVAFSASWDHDPYLLCSAADGGSCVVQNNKFSFVLNGGTSAAAPDMAGIAALLNQKLGGPQGNLNPVLYKLAATPANGVFHDVTAASIGVSSCDVNPPSMCNNSLPSTIGLTGGLAGYVVGTGYDEVTGLGSIDVANLLGSWNTAGVNTSSTTTTLASSANPAVAGTTVTFTATVTTTGSHPPTGTVTFLDTTIQGVDGTTLGTGALNGSGVATFSTSSLALGQHSITAAYPGDANNPESTSAVLTETILTGNPVPVVTSLAPSSTNAGSGAFTLNVIGANFMANSKVQWNGNNRNTTYISSTQLQAAITAADVASAGSVVVTVNNPAPGGPSNSENFEVLETASGTGGFLSMFVNGANLGNSAMFQNSSGLIGLGTTTPGSKLDIALVTPTAANALNTNLSLTNSSPISGAIVSAMNMNFVDYSQASNLSKQVIRMAYNRDVTAIGGVGVFDSLLTASTFLNANALYPLRAMNIEGPNIAAGKTLSTFYGAYFGAPNATGTTGTVTNNFALVTEPGAGNVGIGTITPATALQVVGDIRVGNSGSNGCLQNFSGAGLIGACTSDARLKTNILPFAPVLNKLVLLQPVHFEWNPEANSPYHFGAGRNSGLLAQDVEKVFPEMVSVDAHGFKMVNYSELPYLTLVAIRELKTENDSLRAQLTERDQKLEELQQQVASVEARLARLEKPRSHTAKKRTITTASPKRTAAAKPQF